MQKRSKRILAATLAAAGVLGITGIAYAAGWLQTATGSATADADTFAPVDVVGEWLGRSADDTVTGDEKVMPGESGHVRLKFTIPSGNTVQAKVKSIEAQATSIDVGNGGCAGYVQTSQYAPTMVAKKGQLVTIDLRNAAKLADNTDPVCQGIKFTTNWKVTFEATRGNESTSTSFVLNPVTTIP